MGEDFMASAVFWQQEAAVLARKARNALHEHRGGYQRWAELAAYKARLYMRISGADYIG
jgi:hypothetical protein